VSEFVNLLPSPSSLISSLRDIGYSLETAVADVIDNSISANSRNIDILFSWNSGNPWLAVLDDGCGMTMDTLINAMRFGSTSPLEVRAESDLGRFGLGMKTASLAHCRRLVVFSKQADAISCCMWDIGLLNVSNENMWKLAILDNEAISQTPVLNYLFQEYLSKYPSGTLVLWEDMDRVREDGSEKNFNAALFSVRQHLELVFHRFLSPDAGLKKVRISMNGDNLQAFNPFFTKSLATQELEEQRIYIGGNVITVQPFVLPHHSKVSRQEYEEYAGKDGYLHNQGFYVYRNRRLIINGTWFRLIKKEELNKLIRIKVDIPNSLDHLWKIDVKKSYAFPPEAIRNELKSIVDKIVDRGQKVYRHRGVRISSRIQSPVWVRKAKGGTIVYEINNDHPLLTELSNQLPITSRALLTNYLKIVEAGFPTNMFYNDMASKPEEVRQPALDKDDLTMLLDVFLNTWSSTEMTEDEMVGKILLIEPFASQTQLVRQILANKETLGE
jgi:hypothetical protein